MLADGIRASRLSDDSSFAARTMALIVGLLVVQASIAGAEESADREASTYAVGDTIEAILLEDQHGESAEINTATRVILFSRDMDGGEHLKKALEKIDQESLDRRNVIYVSDISGMPALVARLFALPSMRRRSYVMALDRSGEETARFPDVEGQATLMFLDGLRIRRIEHVESAERVAKLLLLGERN